jgi:hypothetical protein
VMLALQCVWQEGLERTVAMYDGQSEGVTGFGPSIWALTLPVPKFASIWIWGEGRALFRTLRPE